MGKFEKSDEEKKIIADNNIKYGWNISKDVEPEYVGNVLDSPKTNEIPKKDFAFQDKKGKDLKIGDIVQLTVYKVNSYYSLIEENALMKEDNLYRKTNVINGVLISKNDKTMVFGFEHSDYYQWALKTQSIELPNELKKFDHIKYGWSHTGFEKEFKVVGNILDTPKSVATEKQAQEVIKQENTKVEVKKMKSLSQFAIGSTVRVFLDDNGYVVDYETGDSVKAKVLAKASDREVILGFFGDAPVKTSTAAKWKRLSEFGINPSGHSHIGGFKADRQHYDWDEPFSFDDEDNEIYDDEVDEEEYDEPAPMKGKTMKAKVATAPIHKQSFLDMLKEDSKEAMWRSAASNMTSATKAGIVMMLQSKGQSNETIAAVTDALDTEFGAAAISMFLGLGLTYVPQLNEDPRAKRLAKEFRTNGIATGMNAVIGAAMENLVPMISEALKSLPKEEEPKLETGSKDK